MPVLKEEMSAERKNVSLRGTESLTPARITKNNRTTAPIKTQSQLSHVLLPREERNTCLQYKRNPNERTSGHVLDSLF